MPFGGYKDFADCVAQNADKNDPKAFCGTIQAAAEKALRQDGIFRIAKVDAAQRLVFGWASVSQDASGALLEDLQGDVIEPDELEKAVYDFVLYGGGANEMHRGRMKGQLVESLFVSADKLTAMGLEPGTAPKAAWWLGFKLEPDTFAKVQQGDYTMFSIKGHSEAEPIAA